ncbi:aldehyde dehydrogenase [Aspergillus sclerotioniger CBS 115572]|uniref:aldehyde dehydrogenase (NAD(+)) n=1 Tax=Aspergillus sclerotioniger CBS 115572 TaxID=1450535 RepID=A0A317WJP9_9EURO|nr:aldehyde dehydrogenase [Aspergillus sclerotioniger CBS 115572]PWY86583.1 aldehyde dehydrogenase [Aspergillus sclerotioniger CBS 115572]
MTADLCNLPLPIAFSNIYLNGAHTPSHSSETFSLHNPKDDTLVAENIPVADEVDVDKAVGYAESAFQGSWSKFSAAERAACFRRLVDLLEERLEEILRLDSLTTGNPVSLIPTREKGYIINCLLYYAGWTDKHRGDYFPADDGFIKLVRHEPLGVCVAINPFNSPVASLFIKAAPCLATGNVLIVKPSEKSPLGSLAIMPLFEAAGFPPGVIQVLTGDGRTGALLASHMRVRKISFTGSISAGKKIQVAAAQSNLKRVTLELGGKSPAIIFPDADLENAVTWTVNAILARTGQVCVAASRVYVHRSIIDDFLQRYTARMKAAVDDMGDPQDQGYKYGPLVDTSSFKKVSAMILRGKQEARLLVGGNRIGDRGCFIEPTVFFDPKPGAEIYQQEVFGPVSVIRVFDAEDEVVAMANDTEYGLMAGVFTADLNRAMRVSERIEAGVCGVNCVSVMNVQVPFGGKKSSGIGREFGSNALDAYTEPKTVLIYVGKN